MAGYLPQIGRQGKGGIRAGGGLRSALEAPNFRPMWSQPYLETCCRSALHRLLLCAAIGRPPGLKDGPCLERLAGMGLATQRADGRYSLTAAGHARHRTEIAGGGTAAERAGP